MNRNQMTGIMHTEKATNTHSIDGPGSAWRASVGVSMIIPCFFTGIESHGLLCQGRLADGIICSVAFGSVSFLAKTHPHAHGGIFVRSMPDYRRRRC
jgi:hypothetical protein